MYRFAGDACGIDGEKPTLISESDTENFSFDDLTSGSFASYKNNVCGCSKYDKVKFDEYKVTQWDVICPANMPTRTQFENFPGKEKEAAQLVLDNGPNSNAGTVLSPKTERYFVVDNKKGSILESSISELYKLEKEGTLVSFDYATHFDDINFLKDISTLDASKGFPKIIEDTDKQECEEDTSTCKYTVYYGHHKRIKKRYEDCLANQQDALKQGKPVVPCKKFTWNLSRGDSIGEGETVWMYEFDYVDLTVPRKTMNLPFAYFHF